MANVTTVKVLVTCVVLLIAIVAGLVTALVSEEVSPSRRAGRAAMAFVLAIPAEGVVLGIAGFTMG
ncbi:hypothetical protein [Streptomyces catenulae]|uniref:Uncharacterized protein n=1 Tax=Streptomyces catenulae TaxID=66875 RepID=A0ABV2YXQ4_9ACTN|nr:hypothetical protein [Streptomyces catenulae]